MTVFRLQETFLSHYVKRREKADFQIFVESLCKDKITLDLVYIKMIRYPKAFDIQWLMARAQFLSCHVLRYTVNTKHHIRIIPFS